MTLPKKYDPKGVEQKWYDVWEAEGYFRAEGTLSAERSKPYCIVIPPPNVTGSLHMGHALNNTLQDILIRYKRMDGYNVLWQPGTDHAGIATQNVVERQLAKESKTRHDLGREKFVERVWKWREESGGTIIHQLKRLGASCDWDRERFTMDDGLAAAVLDVFVQLHEQGLIYRGDWLINWCPRCLTALSNLEVEHKDKKGNLWHLRYPHDNGYVVVATTRPETMLGDTAVAVNPKDERYKELVGKTVELPLTGRRIPVITDDHAKMEFGSGAVKITPAHDFDDFQVGRRNKLEELSILDEHAEINENAPEKYRGLDRFDARDAVLKDLEAAGLIDKIEDHELSIGQCYRCDTIVEPYLSTQWFVKTEPIAAKALGAVKGGRTRFVPEKWSADYYRWMENILDWCISRQIWWGHQIPAWYCMDCSGEHFTGERPGPEATPIVGKQAPDKCAACAGTNLTRDPDVLDTWFSSALWPFSTLGWPEETDFLDTFYPTSVLCTARDIIFFWVARMMMMGLHFRDEVPFHDVYIHALVLDDKGQKMSKTRGNVIDPLTVMDEFGTDALRFTLAVLAAQGRNIRLSEDTVRGNQSFANKIWNSARFVMMNTEELDTEGGHGDTLADRWMLSRLQTVVAETRSAYDEYRFNDAAGGLYQFFWHEYCDWYLEMIKPEPSAATLRTSVHILRTVLELLHPIMPFVTEEIWQQLPGRQGDTIMLAPFPAAEDRQDLDAERDASLLREVVTTIRNIRGEVNVRPEKKVDSIVVVKDDGARAMLEAQASIVTRLARLENLEITAAAERPKGAAPGHLDGVDVYVPLIGVVDLAEEIKRLQKEITKIENNLAGIEKQLANENFVSRAPENVVAEKRESHTAQTEKLGKLRVTLQRVEELSG